MHPLLPLPSMPSRGSAGARSPTCKKTTRTRVRAQAQKSKPARLGRRSLCDGLSTRASHFRHLHSPLHPLAPRKRPRQRLRSPRPRWRTTGVTLPLAAVTARPERSHPRTSDHDPPPQTSDHDVPPHPGIAEASLSSPTAAHHPACSPLLATYLYSLYPHIRDPIMPHGGLSCSTTNRFTSLVLRFFGQIPF
jgi:hypothetical protein